LKLSVPRRVSTASGVMKEPSVSDWVVIKKLL
jgi:hypothetical protein